MFASHEHYSWEVAVTDGELTASCIEAFEFVWPAPLSLDPFAAIPEQFALHQNYPNPFNPTTTIRFDLPEHSQVQIVIYDVMGREVVRIVDEVRQVGYHQVIWDGRDGRGAQVASGIYFARLVTPKYSKVRKMLLLK